MIHDVNNTNNEQVQDVPSQYPAIIPPERCTAFYEFASAISSIVNLDELLNELSKVITKSLNARGCIIRFSEDGNLRIKASHGLPAEILDMMTQKMEEEFSGLIINGGTSKLIEDTSVLPEELKDLKSMIKSIINVPFKKEDEVIGTISLYDKKGIRDGTFTSFSKDDFLAVEGLALFASLAIEKVIAHKKEIELEKSAQDLYESVSQTKEKLESLIENSADAIVTTDLNGVVMSWNKSAERIYGFPEEEAVGNFIPFLPELTLENEKEYVEAIKRGEILKDIETAGKRKNGETIAISLTLSPIKDEHGNVSSVSIISRDISRRKSVENELVKSNQKLSRLFFIGSAMRGTLELDRLLRMVLTAVTMSDGLGFNRAILFLYDEDKKVLKGIMGVGPASYEEAWKIWQELSLERKSLPNVLKEIEEGPLRKDSFLDKLSIKLELPIEEDCFLTRTVREKKAFHIKNVHDEDLSNPILVQQLGTEAYAAVPLIARDKVIGALWVDNLFNKKPITEDDIEFLTGFADQVATAIESARLFEKVSLAEKELENVFESISDLVYITDDNFTIKKVNKAVCELVEKPMEEVVGKKCYDLFHGKESAWMECPHWKTVKTNRPYISEIERFYYKNDDTFGMSNSPLFDTTGNFMGTIHVVRNITDIKRLREQLARTEKVASLGEMAARVAHEIRNPLVSIGGFARRLEKKLEPPLKEHAHIIINEVIRLETLLRETLGFVRETKIARELIDINSLLRSIIGLLQPAFKDRVSIEENFTTETLELAGDPNRLKEAFINLMKNAEQSIEGLGRISVRTRREFNTAVIEIEDTGRGMNKEEIKYIFDPFFTTKISGTGLGLAITHKIIEEHSGTIDIKSETGVGTIFKIYLTLKEVNHEGTDC